MQNVFYKLWEYICFIGWNKNDKYLKEVSFCSQGRQIY